MEEDERGGGGVGQLSDGAGVGGTKDSFLSGELGAVEGTDNRVCEEEGDGGEIMVEVVGSDVFLDGQKEDAFLPAEIGDVEGRVWEDKEEGSEPLNKGSEEEGDVVSNKGDENKTGGSNELGFLESKDGDDSKEEDVGLSESVGVAGGEVTGLPSSGDGASDDQANPGIEAGAVSSSAETETVTVQTEEVTVTTTTTVVVEEKTTQHEVVDDDIAEVIGEEEATENEAVDEDIGEAKAIESEAVDKDIGEQITEEKAVESEAVDMDIPEAIREEKKIENEAVDKDIGEAISEEKVIGSEAVDMDIPGVISEEETIKDEAVDAVSADLVTRELESHPVEGDVKGKEEILTLAGSNESHDHLVTDATASHGEMTAAGDGQIAPPEGSLDSKCEEPKNVEVDGIDSSVGEVWSINASAGGEVLCIYGVEAKPVDEKEVFTAERKESIHEADAPVSDAHVENQGSLDESHGVQFEGDHGIDGVPHSSSDTVHEKKIDSGKVETSGEVFNDVVDSKEGALSTNVLDNGNKLMNIDEEGVEDDVVHHDRVLSNEPVEMADEGDPEALNKDRGLGVEFKVDTEKSMHVIATTNVEEKGDQKVALSQVEAVDGGEKGDEIIDSEISKQPLECRGNAEIPAVDASAENTCLPTMVACSMVVDTSNFKVSEDGNNNPVISSEVSAQVTETLTPVDESINVIPIEVATVAIPDVSLASISPEITENTELHLDTCDISRDEMMKSTEADDDSHKINGFYVVEGHTSETKVIDGEKERSHHGVEEIDFSESRSEESSEKLTVSNEDALSLKQSAYFSPPEKEGRFSVSDMVWGKVRSHPWWPGQIFDPSDASENALKYYKKDSYLVGYFGDRTFAWNDSSLLKPFRSHFSHVERQSNSEGFQNAVNCALEEVSRRVELGLACSCIRKDEYAKIEAQFVENAGIKEESSLRFGVDQSSRAESFEPDKLLDYVRDLAPRAAYSGLDRLDLGIARAQLSAFCQFKGYRFPSEFPLPGELLEVDEQLSDRIPIGVHKRKQVPKDSSESKKDRSMVELMEYSPDGFEEESVAEDGKLLSGKRRKGLGPLNDGSDKRVGVNQAHKPSFKIGECIRRVASQLTGSTSTLGKEEKAVIDEKTYEQSSVNEMLSQLEMVAQNPKKGRSFLNNNIRNFFMGFRSSVVLSRRGRKKKAEQTAGVSAEEFEFDDVNDSYWTDRIVQNYSEDQLLDNGENGNLQGVQFGIEKAVKPGRKPNSRKRSSGGNNPPVDTGLEEIAKRRKQESSPAELILNFAERKCIPSEINLNKMFRRFGALMESETEVDHESGSAKVIFKRGSDAEVAQSSAEKFNIFGPVVVNYQIGYTPLISVKILPVAVPQSQEDEGLMM